MSNINSAGYGGDIRGSIFAPDRISAKIVQAYQECALLPALAKSDFMSTEELMCGGKVIYGTENPLDLFGSDRQNNEHPEVFEGPGIDTNSMTICQSRKFEWKLSNMDRRIMCNNFDLWEESVRRRLDGGVRKLIDAYSIAKIMASAARYNVGNKAGKISRDIDLGWQDGTARLVDSPASLEALLFDFQQIALEAGMTCGTGDEVISGVGGKPVIILPQQYQRYALKLVQEYDQYANAETPMRTGRIGRILDFEVYTTMQLPAVRYGATQPISQIALIDPSQVLHAFEVIDTKWYEHPYEWSLVGEFVWDTHVVRPEAVSVAHVRRS